ncbi:hypothetical protein [Roseivirga pacifica]|uniref:hypothetical protein n=1 Tax=Roseivirga pacifica TaxID=1267423 RepID=UPI00227D3195|nr:hypothetical protein [Roseivirga pacifica]
MITLKFLLALSTFLLLLGLYKPWRVLWWMSAKNRLTVLKYFGVPWLILLMFYLTA